MSERTPFAKSFKWKLFNSSLTRYMLLSMQSQLLRQWDNIHSNEASWAVFFHGTIFTTLTSNVGVFRYLLYDFVHGSHSKSQGVDITVPKMNEQNHTGPRVVINIQNVFFLDWGKLFDFMAYRSTATLNQNMTIREPYQEKM